MFGFHGSGGRSIARSWKSRPRCFERLETRDMLSATEMGLALSTSLEQITASPLFSGPFQPAAINQAYNFNSILPAGGSGKGLGQTIAIVDAYNNPNIIADTQLFNQTFGLQQFNVPGGPTLTTIDQFGGKSLPATDSGWAMEIALDVQWAHAVAPMANIVVVAARSNSVVDLMTAVDTASSLRGVSVVSMSWGSREFLGQTSLDAHFSPVTHPGVTFIAASGDSGAPGTWPAFSPYVVAVGGTALTTTANGTYTSETGWIGSGGGYSRYEVKPSFQSGFQAASTRSIPRRFVERQPQHRLLRVRFGALFWSGGLVAGRRHERRRAAMGRIVCHRQCVARSRQRDPAGTGRLVFDLRKRSQRLPRHHDRLQRLLGTRGLRPGHRSWQPECKPIGQ